MTDADELAQHLESIGNREARKRFADLATLEACLEFDREPRMWPGRVQFLESLAKWLDEHDTFTFAQRQALEGIARDHGITITRRPA